MHTCRSMILWASQGSGVTDPMTGVLEQKDTGSLGRTGRADEEGMLPSMLMTSWSAWSSAGDG